MEAAGMPHREPLSAAEQTFLMRLAQGNALSLQRQAECDTQRGLTSPSRAATAAPGAETRTLTILMISDVYLPRVNGVSTSITSFCAALERLGHSVALICPAYPMGQTDRPDVLRIGSRGVPGDPEDRMMRYREVLALGTPVVSTAVMGTRDILADGEGCLIAEETHDDFAAKVNRVLSDPALRERLARRGPIHAARWHEDTQAAELVTMYLTSRRDRRTP